MVVAADHPHPGREESGRCLACQPFHADFVSQAATWRRQEVHKSRSSDSGNPFECLEEIDLGLSDTPTVLIPSRAHVKRDHAFGRESRIDLAELVITAGKE